LVYEILLAIWKKHISCLTWHKDFRNFSKWFEAFFSFWSLLKCFHIIILLVWVPWYHMELTITRRHFLNEVMSNWISTWNLRSGLCGIRVKVLNYWFFTWLVVNDCGSNFCLKGHSHCHWSSLSLGLVFGVESLGFDVLFICIWLGHYNNSHGICEFFWIFKINSEATFS
jgi:hypothetical protein